MASASVEAQPARRRRRGSLMLLAAVAFTSCAPSSAEHHPQHEPPPRLRRTNANNHQPQQRERALSAAYCGGNWQDAHDSCDRPCTSGKDEECGPGLYCFSYIDCTPPGSNSGGDGELVPPQFGEPPAGANVPHPAPNQNNPAPSPNYGAWGGYPSEDHGAPILPPSEYMPTYIASLPVRPSDPHRTPAPFVLPKPTPNQKSNPSKNFCGYGWESANDECFHACPSGESKECPGGKTCHSWLTCTPATIDPATFNVCGKNWAHAAATCATRCFLGDDDACPDGESCFGGVSECGDKLPPLTAEDVGLAEKTYTEEEIKQLLDEEIANERDEEAMSNKDNWWCGTSWSNMLETCSKRCTSDADCKPNAWTDGQCFKTTGGPDNCSTPGVPVKDPVPDNARWCGATWNDMLETCDKKCASDDDCGYGRRCWEAPDTCQWIGVPVKEKTQVETLWCGSDYDDAMTGCHRACPGESDDECPSGMSCFSGSSCTTEGVAVVREGYRCGATWEEASKQCGKECQKDDECDVGAGQLCFSDVVCESELLARQSSGMFCGTTWEGTARACHARCEVDEDCPGNQWCYWVECASANVDGASSMQEPKTQPTQASCNAEVKRCPNGQYVARAPQLNCEFHACPGGEDAGGDSGGGNGDAAGGSSAGGGSPGGSGGGSSSAGGGNVGNVATSDVDLSGWGSTPLAHICTADTPGNCGLCEGDCNQDSDCVTGLLCFSRAQGESTTVPGCVSGGEGDKPGMDYCYSPFPPATTTTTTTTTTPIAVVADWDPDSVADLDYARECTSDNPCGACQGDCDVDSHCADNLACYSRGIGGVDPVPGCTGLGVAGMDYCHDPHAPIVGPPTPSPQAASCSAEVRVCRDGSFVYQDPENDCLFPPCPIPGAADAAAKPAPTPAAPSPTPPPTASSPQFDALAAFCGYSVAQVNSNCDDATPCPSGKDDECDGMEVCVLNTSCGQTTTATTGTEEPLSEEDKCNSLCVDVLPSEWCPEETSDLNLPSCLDVGVGELCEADGECDTSDALNNCGTYDIYARVQCGEATASQGQLMRGTTAPTSGPTRPPIPLPTASPVTTKPTASPTQSLRPTSGASQFASVAASASNTSSSEPVTIADAIAIATANSQQGQASSMEGNATNATAPTAYDPNPLGGNYDRNPAGGDAAAYADAADGPTGGWEYEAYQPPPANAEEEDAGAQPPWDFGSYFTPNRNAATVVSTRRCFIVSIGMAVAVGIAIG